MAHDVNYRTKPLSSIYDGVKDLLQGDDLSFINLEFPIDETRDQTSYPSFNVHPSYVEAAIDAGFDIFSLANNHTNDYGLSSVIKTWENMDLFRRRYGAIYSGVYKGDEDRLKVETIQVKDMRVGFLSVTQFNNNYWNKTGAKKVYTYNYENSKHVESLLAFIKEESVKYDCFILSYHGGGEYKKGPSTKRIQFFDDLVEAGVDIVWGHHPHVLQPWKSLTTDRGDGLIIYSMGNFLSGQLAIVDPVSHNIDFAATGFSALFRVNIATKEGKLKIERPVIDMIANIRNENRYFIAVKKEVALNSPMDDKWKSFYKKMFPLAEDRIREVYID